MPVVAVKLTVPPVRAKLPKVRMVFWPLLVTLIVELPVVAERAAVKV